jgi:hypothetical protein
MMKILRQWFASLHEVERDLWSQGYIVIYGGCTSFVVPIGSNNKTIRRPGKRSLLWASAPAAFQLGLDCRHMRVHQIT